MAVLSKISRDVFKSHLEFLHECISDSDKSDIELDSDNGMNNNTQEPVLAIMPSTTHPEMFAELSLHECIHNMSSVIQNLLLTLPQ